MTIALLENNLNCHFPQKKTKVAPEPGEIIHTDLCGPMETASVGGAKFFLLFKDEASGFRTVYFLKHKSDTFEYIKIFVNLLKTYFEK